MTPPTFFRRSELTTALWTFRRELAAVGILSCLTNLLMLLPTIYLLQIFDRVLTSQSGITLLVISVITLALFAVMALSEWLRSRMLIRAGRRLDEQLSTRVFGASFQASLDSSTTGTSKPFADLIQLRQFLTGPGILALFDAPWVPIYIAVAFFLHPWLGLLALVFAACQCALAWFGHRNAVTPSEEALKASSDMTAYLQGKLHNTELLESMGMLAGLKMRWQQKYNASLRKSTAAQGWTHRVAAWSKFIRYSQQSIALGAGALLVIDGRLSPGAMIAVTMLISRALAPIDQLVSLSRGLASCRSAFLRIEKLLAAHPALRTGGTPAIPTGNICLRGLTATAPGRADPILKDISFDVTAGTVVAVLGPSGSGKSTLARALLGIWPEATGHVLLDGKPIQDWDRLALGPLIGYLPQDVELFDGTMAENIARLGTVDGAKVIAAARGAGMHDMILRFEGGYDTPIGEAGRFLSGGQRQRLGLARALYGDPRVVVLDEPNANLDDAGEAALLRTLRQLKARGVTVFLVTHRTSALAIADRIMVLRDGEMTQDGPREVVLSTILRPGLAALAPVGSAQPV
jgi:ATP-binding cassette, subfamily C, bacterial exporter for protease/lipase